MPLLSSAWVSQNHLPHLVQRTVAGRWHGSSLSDMARQKRRSESTLHSCSPIRLLLVTSARRRGNQRNMERGPFAGVRTARRCFAALSIDAQDGRGARSHGIESTFGEGALATALPGDTAAVSCFSRRSSKMLAEGFAVLVKESCVGSLQRPSGLRGSLLHT